MSVADKSTETPLAFLKSLDCLEQFGTAGNASRIKVIPLSELAKRYRSGALDPEIKNLTAAA